MSSKRKALPPGWCWATVGDTGRYINGFAFKPAHREAAGRPIVRIQNLTDPKKPLNRTLLAVSEDFHVATGEILVSWSATVDVFVWNREPALVNQHIFRVVPKEGVVDRAFLFYWLKIAIDQLLKSEHLHGSTMKHINRGPFMAHQIPLPPLAEQKRIVETLESLLSDLDAGMAELEAAQRKLAQYRQSLLKAAMEGALTVDWRATHGKPQETGAELLRRILSERRARWEQKQLAKFAEQGKTPPANWQAKYPEPVAPDLTDLPLLPEGWAWSSLSQVGWLDRGRSKHRPRNAPHLYGGPYPFVQTGDIRDADTFIHKASASYSEAGLAQSRLWPAETLCITIAANIGKTALLAMQACFPDSVVGFLAASDEVSVRYIEYFMRSAQQKLEAEAPATAQKNINLEILERLPVPVPPSAEQIALVERLSEAISAARAQDDAIEHGIKQAVAQRKNLLKAAFAGQLVPQDPSDESAFELLARIRAAREAKADVTTASKRGRKAKETA
ncbi:restriction endonuclease subunit S [Lysobacter enzymogenes]|uniref:restriction endonuclease subunit S n=1 Tax=Lysobacter enzymogenes TaxID=69 RepID=UPI0019CF71DE|nr:restriction endonuclease subunit S [Lysobacter enzymogenes]